MAQPSYYTNCTLKGGAKCFLQACNETGECKLAHKLLDNIIAKDNDVTDPNNHPPDDKPAQTQTACHSGLYALGTVGRTQVWVGREAAISTGIRQGDPIMKDRGSVALIVNCAGDVPWNVAHDKAGAVTGNKEAKALLPARLFREKAPVPELVLDWPDFGTPALSAGWWMRLNAALHDVGGDVIFHCVGGHGRTGTAASILAALNGWAGDKCPVTWVREMYCRNAVESWEQIAYITQMTGAKVSAEPGKEYGYLQGSWTTWKQATKLPTKKRPTMSLRKYKKWYREHTKKYPTVKPPTVKELTEAGAPQRVLFAGGEWWRFDPQDKTFTYLENRVDNT